MTAFGTHRSSPIAHRSPPVPIGDERPSMDPLLAELIGAEEGESVEAFIARELGEANRKRNRNGRPGPPDRHGRSDQSSEGETRRATESHGKD